MLFSQRVLAANRDRSAEALVEGANKKRTENVRQKNKGLSTISTHCGMEEVVGSIPTGTTKSYKLLLRLPTSCHRRLRRTHG